MAIRSALNTERTVVCGLHSKRRIEEPEMLAMSRRRLAQC